MIKNACHVFRYPMIVDNSTVPLLEQWLAASRGDQGKFMEST